MSATSTRSADHPRRRRLLVIAGVVAGLLIASAAVAGLGYAALMAFNPMGDEYVCSEGEVPGGRAPVGPGEGNNCYIPGKLPRGIEADPFGNRPMAFNCDKSGYRLVVKTEGKRASEHEECIADETEIPSGWALSDED